MIFPLLNFKEKKEIIIAGKLGSEPEILINMYKMLIENETDLKVQLKPGLGKTSFVLMHLNLAASIFIQNSLERQFQSF